MGSGLTSACAREWAPYNDSEVCLYTTLSFSLSSSHLDDLKCGQVRTESLVDICACMDSIRVTKARPSIDNGEQIAHNDCLK